MFEQRSLEASQGQTHGGTCDFAGAVALSSEKEEKGFFVNTIAVLIQKLVAWMSSEERKPMVLKGARQGERPG